MSGTLSTVGQFSLVGSNSIIAITISNNTSSITLLRLLCSLEGRLGVAIGTTRLGRLVHKRRTSHSRTFIGGLYRVLGVRLFYREVGIPGVTGRGGRDLRLTTEYAHCNFFRNVYRKGVTATRATGSGTRAVLLGLDHKDKLQKLYKVPPGHSVCVHPLVLYDHYSVRGCYTSGNLAFIASDAGLSSSCAQGGVQRGTLPALYRVGSGIVSILDHATRVL